MKICAIALLVPVFFSFSTIPSIAAEQRKPDENEDRRPPAVDNRTTEQIYQAALAEGGPLMLYANGNRAFMARTLNSTVPAFERRFPGIKLRVVVDNTNLLASRVNVQLANRSLVADLVQLESVHDFYRWKAQGKLHLYKPAAWENIYHKFKDPDGAFTSISGTVFSMVVNTDRLGNNPSEWPQSYGDLVDQARFRNALLGAYPIDVGSPDTSLYGYKLVVDKYGFDWPLVGAQNATFLRDSSLIPAAMGSGQFGVGLFRVWPGNVSNQRFLLPAEEKFVSYTVLTAIFKETRHKEAAKLYMNWMLEREMQATLPWTVRTDVPPMAGFKHIWEYGAQSSYDDFVHFYLDRAGVEKFRQSVYLFLGDPTGPRPMDPNNLLGISPQ